MTNLCYHWTPLVLRGTRSSLAFPRGPTNTLSGGRVMKATLGMGLAAPAVLVSTLATTRPVFAQACKDEQAMVDEFKQGLLANVETVKKESLDNFEKAFHQK